MLFFGSMIGRDGCAHETHSLDNNVLTVDI